MHTRGTPTPETIQIDAAAPVAGAYGRSSIVFGEEDRVSTERQRDKIVDTATKVNLNVEYFVDAEGHRSGRYEHTRPAYRAFKRGLLSGRWRTIIFARLDRANRSVKETVWLVEYCKEHSVRLIIIDARFDSERDGWGARIIRDLYQDAVDNQYEADRTSDRTKDSIAWAKARGVYWGCTPKGLLRVGVGLKARLIYRKRDEPLSKKPIDNATSDVRQCLTLYATSGYATVADELNARGVHYFDREGLPQHWTADRVRQIVNNILVYCGYLIPRAGHSFSRKIRQDAPGESMLERLANAYDARRVSSIDPVLDPSDPSDAALIERIIERRYLTQGAALRGRAYKDHTPLLSPILFWRGNKLRAQMQHGYRYYLTRTIKPQRSWHAEEIERELLDNLRGVALPTAVISHVRSMLADRVHDDRQQQAKADLTRADTRLQAVQNLRLDLEERKLKGLDVDQVRTERARLDDLAMAAERARDVARQTLAAAGQIDMLIGSLTELGERIDRMTPTQKRGAILSMFDQIEIDDDGRIVRLDPAPWAKIVFGQMVAAWQRVIPNMIHTGLEPEVGIPVELKCTHWLFTRVRAAETIA